jgi:cell division septum initiation protein DivIVA
MTDYKALDDAFHDLEYEDEIEVNYLRVQTEAEHLKQEIIELQKLLIEYDIELRKRNQMIAKIEAAMI